MKPKPFWLLNHFTVPIAIVISFQLTMHSGGRMRNSSRPSSRLVDFGEIPETCSSIENETERPSRSAKDRWSQSSDFLGQLQGGTRLWRAGQAFLFCAAKCGRRPRQSTINSVAPTAVEERCAASPKSETW